MLVILSRKHERKQEVKKKNLLIKGKRYEIKELNEKANKAEKCKAAVLIIRAYEEIIKKRTLYALLLDKVLFFKSLKGRKTKKHAHQRRKI